MMMLDSYAPDRPAAAPLSLLLAADLQDSLLAASHDLERLQGLLAHACDALLQGFEGASERLREFDPLVAGDGRLTALRARVMADLGVAVTALQFQDMASQLITHTDARLRHCADRLARETMGDDEDGDAVVDAAPLRPNPVTQDEMDAGSVELF